MAVSQTGAIYKSLHFDGEDSRDYGVYITGEAVFNAPEREVEMISIPGRSGQLALDKGRFENIPVTYPAGIFADTEADFAEAISNFRNLLCSRRGYVRIQDDYNPDEYRLGVYKSGLEVENAQLRAGEFDIVFDCKPQRYLTSGEEPVTIGDWSETWTESGDIVQIDNPDGDYLVKSLTVTLSPIQDLHGYDKPWAGGSGVNKWDEEWELGGIVNATGQPYSATDRIRSKNFCRCLPNTNYFGKVAYAIYFYDETYAFISYTGTLAQGSVITTPSTANYFKIVKTGVTTYENNICFNYPSTVTSYEPYSNLCPISGRTECVTEVSGVNVWDEEWEAGAISNSSGQNSSLADAVRSKGYIAIKPSTQYYVLTPTRVYIRFYDADKTYLGSSASIQNVSSSVFTTPTNAYYMRFYAPISGSVYNHDISINYPSTDTSYHAHDGHTYTTTLGRTVYGGTLNVVTGELVVDRAMVTYDGSEAWRGSSSQGYYIACNDLVKALDYADKIICDKAETFSYNNPQFVGSDIGITGYYDGGNIYPNQNWIYVQNANANTVAAFKAWLAENSLQVVYELKQPQTFQLSPTEVELLAGQNNVWSDGSIEMEYGTLITGVTNPTLFESSPLLEIKGYGGININDETVSVNGGALGWVTAANRNKVTGYTVSVGFSTQYANIGDEIVVGHGEIYVPVTWSEDGINWYDYSVVGDGDGSFDQGADYQATFWAYIPSTVKYYYGTSATHSVEVTFRTWDGQGQEINIVLEIALAYDGNDEFTATANATVPTGFTIRGAQTEIDKVRINSTQSILGDPLYFDLDMGEAYKMEGGVPVSVNSGVTMPNDLPKLKPGENPITFDDTITDLKVVPRWWKL